MCCLGEVKKVPCLWELKNMDGCYIYIVPKFLVPEKFMWRIVTHNKQTYLAIGASKVLSQGYEQIFSWTAFLTMKILVKNGKIYFKVGEPNWKAKQGSTADAGYRWAHKFSK